LGCSFWFDVAMLAAAAGLMKLLAAAAAAME